MISSIWSPLVVSISLVHLFCFVLWSPPLGVDRWCHCLLVFCLDLRRYESRRGFAFSCLCSLTFLSLRSSFPPGLLSCLLFPAVSWVSVFRDVQGFSLISFVSGQVGSNTCAHANRNTPTLIHCAPQCRDLKETKIGTKLLLWNLRTKETRGEIGKKENYLHPWMLTYIVLIIIEAIIILFRGPIPAISSWL